MKASNACAKLECLDIIVQGYTGDQWEESKLNICNKYGTVPMFIKRIKFLEM